MASSMKLAFYSIVLNNHQANVADELWELTGHEYYFVELVEPTADNAKGGTDDYGSRPYILKAWESAESYQYAMELALTVDCCVFSGLPALPFKKARMDKGLLSFDMSERWLKRGLKNALSPTIFRELIAYHLGSWGRKPLYKLCCSAFAAGDQHRLGTFKDKCYKWGYFTRVDPSGPHGPEGVSTADAVTPLMWCSRHLPWKHPELPLRMFQRLRSKGYDISLDMYGEGELRERSEQLAIDLGIADRVKFYNNMPNDRLQTEMRRHAIFLFTSDRNEGWGAVANESMANGCVLVAGDAIGSTPYLIENGKTGLSFRSPSTSSSFDRPDMNALDSLCSQVEMLLSNPSLFNTIRANSINLMTNEYRPYKVAERFLSLVKALSSGSETPFAKGPCSKA